MFGIQSRPFLVFFFSCPQRRQGCEDEVGCTHFESAAGRSTAPLFPAPPNYVVEAPSAVPSGSPGWDRYLASSGTWLVRDCLRRDEVSRYATRSPDRHSWTGVRRWVSVCTGWLAEARRRKHPCCSSSGLAWATRFYLGASARFPKRMLSFFWVYIFFFQLLSFEILYLVAFSKRNEHRRQDESSRARQIRAGE